MTIALVTGQHAVTSSSASGTTIAVAFPANVTAGNLITAGVSGSGVNVQSIADTPLNSYASKVVDNGNVGIGTMEGWRAFNITGGACTVTVTYTGTVSFRMLQIAEWSGVQSTSDPTDKTADTQNTGSAGSGITSPDVTPTTDGQLIWILGGENTGTPTPNSPFTLIDNEATDSSCTGYQVQGGAAAVHGDINFTGAAHWTVILMTFKAAASPIVTGAVAHPFGQELSRPVVGNLF